MASASPTARPGGTTRVVGGWLGRFWSVMDKSAFFLMIAGVAALAGLVILAFNRPLRAALRE